jgi:hypothetical protein
MQKTLEVRRYEQEATLRDRFGCALKFEGHCQLAESETARRRV